MNGSKSRKVFETPCQVLQAAISSKRTRQLFASLLVALLLANTQAKGQAEGQVPPRGVSGDWQAVKNLMPGTRISGKTGHRYLCAVEEVTDEELLCEAHLPRSFRMNTLVIRRSEIEEVRILPHPNQTKDMWIGAGIGAGAGAVVAGTNSGAYPGAHAFFGGLAGALPGAIVGEMVPIFQVIFQRGKIIYKR